MILGSKKISFEKVDIAASEDAKQKMRKIVGDSAALPPQLCNGDTYCGVCVYACDIRAYRILLNGKKTITRKCVSVRLLNYMSFFFEEL